VILRLTSGEARERLREYLESAAETSGPQTSVPRRLAKSVVSEALLFTVRRLATDAMVIQQRRLANRLAQRTPLRLHLGSGRTPLTGWLNVDVLGAPTDLAWNLNRALPFPTATVDSIFHEHVLEHLPLRDGLTLTQECHRLLKPDGVLRIGVPDAGSYLRAYPDDADHFLDVNRPGRPTPLLAIQEIFYLHGHRTMFDFETLALVCRAAGFQQVERRRFGDSRIVPTPDGEHRREETLYVEAVR
jgi:predicted SAM-dependent methyltransferase